MTGGSGLGTRPGRSHYYLFLVVSLLLFPSVVCVFIYLPRPSSRRGLRLTTRRFGLDNPESPLTAPTASHSIVSRPFGGLYCSRCGETMNFKTNCAPAAAEKAAAHALELIKIKAAAKRDFGRNVTSVLIGCLALAVVSFFSREVAGWVKTTVVPQLNSTGERLIGLMGGVIGFVIGVIFR
jgi:hypothetical protein